MADLGFITEALADGPADDTPEAPPPADMLATAAEYAELSNRLRDATGECDALKAKMQKLEPLLLEAMAINGVQNLRAKGRTVFIKRTFYASKKGEFQMQEVCERLTDHGLDYLVAPAYNGSSVKSKLREWMEEGVEIPPRLAECFNVGEAVTLGTRS